MTHEISMRVHNGGLTTHIFISGNDKLVCLQMRSFLYCLDNYVGILKIDRELNGFGGMPLRRFRLILRMRALGKLLRGHKRRYKLRIRYTRYKTEEED